MVRQRTVAAISEIINEDYGIELKWNERVALMCFLDRFPLPDAICLFMSHTFGLDDTVCRDSYCPYTDSRVGMGLIGQENFKEYCRLRVSFWREQRELI